MLFCETVGNTEYCLVCDSCNELTQHLLQAAKLVVCAMLQDCDQTHSFIDLFTSIYPLAGASQGCGDSHNIMRNISVELQMS